MPELTEQQISFMTSTAATLSRIETKQDISSEEIKAIKSNCNSCLSKIPLIEQGLNNHLSSHTKLWKYFFWPIGVATTSTMILMILKWVIKII